MTAKKYPRCHFCKQEIAEGNKIESRYSKETFLVCHDCTEIIGAIAHSYAGGVFSDIHHIINDPEEKWKDRLEPWQIKEAD
jgi:hypothetical protein